MQSKWAPCESRAPPGRKTDRRAQVQLETPRCQTTMWPSACHHLNRQTRMDLRGSAAETQRKKSLVFGPPIVDCACLLSVASWLGCVSWAPSFSSSFGGRRRRLKQKRAGQNLKGAPHEMCASKGEKSTGKGRMWAGGWAGVAAVLRLPPIKRVRVASLRQRRGRPHPILLPAWGHPHHLSVSPLTSLLTSMRTTPQAASTRRDRARAFIHLLPSFLSFLPSFLLQAPHPKQQASTRPPPPPSPPPPSASRSSSTLHHTLLDGAKATNEDTGGSNSSRSSMQPAAASTTKTSTVLLPPSPHNPPGNP